MRGQFPLNKELAYELASLMAQIHFGDHQSQQQQQAAQALERFFPSRYHDGEEEGKETSSSASVLAQKWSSLRGKSSHDCVRIFLTCTRKWQFFGASLFEVQVGTQFLMSLAILPKVLSLFFSCISLCERTTEAATMMKTTKRRRTPPAPTWAGTASGDSAAAREAFAAAAIAAAPPAAPPALRTGFALARTASPSWTTAACSPRLDSPTLTWSPSAGAR